MVVGLTGGIASGKSLCSDWFIKQSLHVIDADVIARALLSSDKLLLSELADTFGNIILTTEYALNRLVLRKLIFTDESARERLNRIMHPRIREVLVRELLVLPKEPYCVLSAPLLLENELNSFCDVVVSIDTSTHMQILRGSKRDGVDESSIASIIQVQISRYKRIRKTNFIINNECDIYGTYEQLEILHQLFCSWKQY